MREKEEKKARPMSPLQTTTLSLISKRSHICAPAHIAVMCIYIVFSVFFFIQFHFRKQLPRGDHFKERPNMIREKSVHSRINTRVACVYEYEYANESQTGDVFL